MPCPLRALAIQGDRGACLRWLADARAKHIKLTTDHYNSMINVWARRSTRPEEVERAVSYLNDMTNDKVAPNENSYVMLVHAATRVKETLPLAHKLFGQMQESGFVPDIRLYNSFLAAYSKKGDRHEVQAWLDKMTAANLQHSDVTYNILSRTHSNRIAREQNRAEQESLEQNSEHDSRSYASGSSSRSLPIYSYGAASSSSTPPPSPPASPELKRHRDVLRSFMRFDDPQGAARWIDHMKNVLNVEPDKECWTYCIQAHLGSGDLESAERFLDQMVHAGFSPDETVFLKLIHTCARNNDDVNALRWLAMYESSCDDNSSPSDSSNSLSAKAYEWIIYLYAKQGDIENAKKYMDRVKSKGLAPSVESYNAMIYGYTQLADATGANNMFDEMMSLRVLPTRVTYNSLIGNSARLVDTKAAKFWFDKMRTVRISVNRISFNSMISAYAREGDSVLAKKYFDMLANDGKQLPDSRSYDSMLLCSVVCGDGAMAEQWFAQMKDSGIRPSVTSFNTVMQAFHTRGELEKVKYWHAELESNEFTRPNETTFATIIEACAIGGDVESAQDHYEQMLKANFIDHNVSASVVYAHMVNNDIESAKAILAKIPITPSSSSTSTTSAASFSSMTTANEVPPTFTKMLEFTELFGSVLADSQLPVTAGDANRCIMEIDKAAEALDVFKLVVWLSKMEQCNLSIGISTLQLASEVFCKRSGSQGVRRWWGKMLSGGLVPHHAIYNAAVESLRRDSFYAISKADLVQSETASTSATSSTRPSVPPVPNLNSDWNAKSYSSEEWYQSNVESKATEFTPPAVEEFQLKDTLLYRISESEQLDPKSLFKANLDRFHSECKKDSTDIQKNIPRLRVVSADSFPETVELWHLQDRSIKTKGRRNKSGQSVFIPSCDD